MSTNHPFNNLTPAEVERLALLSEECAEVIQIVGKILRHGYESTHPDGGPTNRVLLAIELGHVDFAMFLMVDNGDVNGVQINSESAEKGLRITKYLHHQNSYTTTGDDDFECQECRGMNGQHDACCPHANEPNQHL